MHSPATRAPPWIRSVRGRRMHTTRGTGKGTEARGAPTSANSAGSPCWPRQCGVEATKTKTSFCFFCRSFAWLRPSGPALRAWAWRSWKRAVKGMVLMKPVKAKRRGGGNSNPPKRTPFPDIDQAHLDSKLEDYVRSMGIQQAFNMHQYKGMQVQQSACPQAIFRLHPLLDCLLDVSPTGQLKYRCLKQSLEGIAQKFGCVEGAQTLLAPSSTIGGELLHHLPHGPSFVRSLTSLRHNAWRGSTRRQVQKRGH